MEGYSFNHINMIPLIISETKGGPQQTWRLVKVSSRKEEASWKDIPLIISQIKGPDIAARNPGGNRSSYSTGWTGKCSNFSSSWTFGRRILWKTNFQHYELHCLLKGVRKRVKMSHFISNIIQTIDKNYSLVRTFFKGARKISAIPKIQISNTKITMQ